MKNMGLTQHNWFRLAFRLQGSIIPAILPRSALCGGLGLIASVLYFNGLPVNFPFNSFIPDLVLGLLLVFRTNTAYERFWEGRKLWGSLVNLVRNMSRQIWITVQDQTPREYTEKVATLRLLVAFAISVKLHLRHQPINDEIRALITPEKYKKLLAMNHPPLEIAFWIGDYLQAQYQHDRLTLYQLTIMQEGLNAMIDALGGCERILKTPIPLAYTIHLKQLILFYCLTLPFQVVSNVGWWTGPIIAVVSFIVFGVEEIGIEIENPFGCDANDLPLDAICNTMLRNIEDLITLSPCTTSSIHNDNNLQQALF